jgi:hypothetical protein
MSPRLFDQRRTLHLPFGSVLITPNIVDCRRKEKKIRIVRNFGVEIAWRNCGFAGLCVLEPVIR